MERTRRYGRGLKCGLLRLAVCLLPAIASGQVSSLSYTGTLNNPRSVFEVTFKLTASDTVTIKTFGFGGGTNGASQVIPAGGFDPLIALFDGPIATATMHVGGQGNPVADADNLANEPWSFNGNCPAAGTVNIGANHDCGDVKIQVALVAGTYTLLLSDANYQPGAIYDTGALSEPFVDLTGGAAEFQTCDPAVDVCITPNGNYSVDIDATKQSLVAITKCDVNIDGITDVSDVRQMISEALGTGSPDNDLSANGKLNVVDVQIDINATKGLGCSAK